MPYIGPDGRVAERRSPWRLSIISDFFRGVYDFLAIFFSGLLNPMLNGDVRMHACTHALSEQSHPNVYCYSCLTSLIFIDPCLTRLGVQITEIDTRAVRVVQVVLVLVLVEDLLAVLVIFEESKTCKGPLTILVEVVDEVVKARGERGRLHRRKDNIMGSSILRPCV